MAHKLLVISAGTVAAGVGKEFIKQINTHPKSEINEVVRYIDTAYLPTRYSDLHDGEWTQINIDPRYIDNIRRNKEDYEHLKPLLFDNLMPQIQGSGGGSIRYNAAGAVAIGRDRLKNWIHTAITNLISSDDGQVNLSIALIVSAVGATGSGTLERLVEMIVDAGQDANIPSPIHCDVFILQPGPQGVTDLGLANTLALYAEMAASRLSSTQLNNRSYRGRTFMVGWGSKTYMSSIEQLIEAAATLVRLTHDPASNIAAEYQEREVDNHVLREQDTQSRLPSHLSTATVVTISLGDLEEKIIHRDAAKLIDLLVFGGTPTESGGELLYRRNSDQKANLLLDTIEGFLGGATPEERYKRLTRMLREELKLQSLGMTAPQMSSMTTKEQASQLNTIWRIDKDELKKSGAQKVQEKGDILALTAIEDMRRMRTERMANTGLSLQQLRDEYKEVLDLLGTIQKVAQDSNSSNAVLNLGGDDEVTRRINTLEKAWRFTPNRAGLLNMAMEAVRTDIRTLVNQEARKVAVTVLEELVRHCSQAYRDLSLVYQKFQKQRKKNEGWAAADQELRIEMNHPLHLAALPTREDIINYADQVSIFTSGEKGRSSAAARLAGEDQGGDQTVAFRKWLEDNSYLDALFKGDIDLLLNVAQQYTREHVEDEVSENNVLKVLLRAGEEVLSSRLKEAAGKAHSLVSFSPQFAADLRESRHVSAFWENEEQRGQLQNAVNGAFGQGQCTLIRSKDPTEIAVFYYADGLPMSAINDLTGRCLDAFLKRRRAWTIQTKSLHTIHSNGNGSLQEHNAINQRVGVPVYSGKDAQQRVVETGVIRLLYRVHGQNVGTYTKEDVPELELPLVETQQQESGPIHVPSPLKDSHMPNSNGGTSSASSINDNSNGE